MRILSGGSPPALVVPVALAVPVLPFCRSELEVVDQIVLLCLGVLEALDVRFAILRRRR